MNIFEDINNNKECSYQPLVDDNEEDLNTVEPGSIEDRTQQCTKTVLSAPPPPLKKLKLRALVVSDGKELNAYFRESTRNDDTLFEARMRLFKYQEASEPSQSCKNVAKALQKALGQARNVPYTNPQELLKEVGLRDEDCAHVNTVLEALRKIPVSPVNATPIKTTFSQEHFFKLHPSLALTGYCVREIHGIKRLFIPGHSQAQNIDPASLPEPGFYQPHDPFLGKILPQRVVTIRKKRFVIKDQNLLRKFERARAQNPGKKITVAALKSNVEIGCEELFEDTAASLKALKVLKNLDGKKNAELAFVAKAFDLLLRSQDTQEYREANFDIVSLLYAQAMHLDSSICATLFDRTALPIMLTQEGRAALELLCKKVFPDKHKSEDRLSLCDHIFSLFRDPASSQSGQLRLDVFCKSSEEATRLHAIKLGLVSKDKGIWQKGLDAAIERHKANPRVQYFKLKYYVYQATIACVNSLWRSERLLSDKKLKKEIKETIFKKHPLYRLLPSHLLNHMISKNLERIHGFLTSENPAIQTDASNCDCKKALFAIFAALQEKDMAHTEQELVQLCYGLFFEFAQYAEIPATQMRKYFKKGFKATEELVALAHEFTSSSPFRDSTSEHPDV